VSELVEVGRVGKPARASQSAFFVEQGEQRSW
jgi:hypothetical protein